MILSWREDRWQDTEVSLFDAWNLDRDHREILSLTGGGGKTTVIRRLPERVHGETYFSWNCHYYSYAI